MSGKRSNWSLGLKVAVGPVLIMTIWIVAGAQPSILILGGLFLAFQAWADFQRRITLFQRSDGMFVWIEWHGGERCALTDPSAPGGEWDSDGGGGDGGD